MMIKAKNGGISISMSGDETAAAIWQWMKSQGVLIIGARTTRVNDSQIEGSTTFVDPSGHVDILEPIQ